MSTEWSHGKPKAAEELALVRKQEAEIANAWMKDLSEFDWKRIPPHQMAVVLTKIPRRGKTGDPDYYLTPAQALVFAMRCFELNLSPLSTQVWFDPARWTTNVTLEGQIELARSRGMTGAPSFTELHRPWKKGQTPILGFAEEPGIRCVVKTTSGDTSYTCWLSEWIVPTSPVWKGKPHHMMQVRAYEKALEFSGGVGVSSMPNETNIEGVPELPQLNPENLVPVLEKSIEEAKKK